MRKEGLIGCLGNEGTRNPQLLWPCSPTTTRDRLLASTPAGKAAAPTCRPGYHCFRASTNDSEVGLSRERDGAFSGLASSVMRCTDRAGSERAEADPAPDKDPDAALLRIVALILGKPRKT